MATLKRGIESDSSSALLREAGQSMAEYIIIAVLVAVIVIVAVRRFGGGVSSQVDTATEIVGSVRDDPESSAAARLDSAPIRPREDDGGFKDSGSGRSAGGADGAPQGSSDSLRAEGVGASGYKPVESIKIEWWMIASLAAFVVLAGIGVVVYLQRRTRGDRKKKKKKSLFQFKTKPGKTG